MPRQMTGFFVRRSDGPYALFCQDTKISKAYPTEADVWEHAYQNGLVVEVSSDTEGSTPKRVLDGGYEIKSCDPDPPETNDSMTWDIDLPLSLSS